MFFLFLSRSGVRSSRPLLSSQALNLAPPSLADSKSTPPSSQLAAELASIALRHALPSDRSVVSPTFFIAARRAGVCIALRNALPSARFTIHHAIGRHDPMMSPRAAVRWSLDGTLDGWGVFGAPSGARAHVMGLSHAEFGTLGKAAPTLRRDFTLFDETAIWKQILLQTGDL